MADREEAMGDICDYNQAGTVRVLKQYNQLYKSYPDDLHSCLQTNASGAATMEGVPNAQAANMTETAGVFNYTAEALSAEEVLSLKAAGIDSIAYGNTPPGEAVATTSYVVKVDSTWKDDGDAEYSFDGQSITDWCAKDVNGDGTADTGEVIALWIAPTVDWTPDVANANQDWTNGAVQLSIDLEGQCPIPAEGVGGQDVAFAYYMAYFWVDDTTGRTADDIVSARLIGTSCPECGIMNP